jgi:predicted alpha/beta-fold hydrolase
VGGNLALNTLAAWGETPPPELAGAVLLCPAVDIAHCVERLDSPANALYRSFFLRNLLGLYARKAALNGTRFPAARVHGIRTVRDFDRAVTGPESGFSDVGEFYEWVSAAHRLAHIRVPTLLVHADDDPLVHFLPATRAAIRQNPALAFVTAERGGHCGFTEAPSARRLDGRWAAHQIVRAAVRLA